MNVRSITRARTRLAVAVVVASAAACAHVAESAGPVAWPEEQRLDGRALVLRDLAAEMTLQDPRPASAIPGATLYATAVAELVQDAMLDEMGALFRGGAEPATEPARRKGFRVVASPRTLDVGGASGLAISTSVRVELLDAEGRTVRETRVEGGLLQGRADFPRGVAGPRIGGAARATIDRLARRVAEAARELAAGG